MVHARHALRCRRHAVPAYRLSRCLPCLLPSRFSSLPQLAAAALTPRTRFMPGAFCTFLAYIAAPLHALRCARRPPTCTPVRATGSVRILPRAYKRRHSSRRLWRSCLLPAFHLPTLFCDIAAAATRVSPYCTCRSVRCSITYKRADGCYLLNILFLLPLLLPLSIAFCRHLFFSPCCLFHNNTAFVAAFHSRLPRVAERAAHIA